jgi:hypothetical protein
MILLSYQPAFDAAHTIFRFLRLHDAMRMDVVEFDKYRILDYYLLFPFRSATVRLGQKDLRIRSIAKQLDGKAGYATLPSGEVLFERMKNAHVSASQTMAANRIIDPEVLRHGVMKFGKFALPADYQERISEANQNDSLTLDILRALSAYNLLGRDGLKDRTGLLEYRYDNV